MNHLIRKIDAGERLTSADARYLLSDAPLLEVGALADEVRRRRHPGRRRDLRG